MILYMAPVTAEELMNLSPKEMKKGMEIWFASLKVLLEGSRLFR